MIFLKAASSVIGSGGTVLLPRLSREVFTEAELAVVIGSRAKHLTPETALSCVAGYTMANDLGASDLEKRTSQWTTGKLMDTFCPLGPSLLTTDELQRTDDLAMTTRINGKTVQLGNTRDMIFAVPFLVSYVSELATLEPGDVILTGSPKLMNGKPAPVVFLNPGDVVEVGIGGTSASCGTRSPTNRWRKDDMTDKTYPMAFVTAPGVIEFLPHERVPLPRGRCDWRSGPAPSAAATCTSSQGKASLRPAPRQRGTRVGRRCDRDRRCRDQGQARRPRHRGAGDRLRNL